MDELIEELKTALATSFAFYLKAQYFHWNVTGKDFVQLHDFFGKLYEEVLDSIDTMAEHIRALEAFSPGGLKRMVDLSLISDTDIIPSDHEMVNILLQDNQILTNHLNKVFELADSENEQGLADFISQRLASHKKHAWMLRSILSK
jgi:starvation-inducible DNA-binding protein